MSGPALLPGPRQCWLACSVWGAAGAERSRLGNTPCSVPHHPDTPRSKISQIHSDLLDILRSPPLGPPTWLASTVFSPYPPPDLPSISASSRPPLTWLASSSWWQQTWLRQLRAAAFKSGGVREPRTCKGERGGGGRGVRGLSTCEREEGGGRKGATHLQEGQGGRQGRSSAAPPPLPPPLPSSSYKPSGGLQTLLLPLPNSPPSFRTSLVRGSSACCSTTAPAS